MISAAVYQYKNDPHGSATNIDPPSSFRKTLISPDGADILIAQSGAPAERIRRTRPNCPIACACTCVRATTTCVPNGSTSTGDALHFVSQHAPPSRHGCPRNGVFMTYLTVDRQASVSVRHQARVRRGACRICTSRCRTWICLAGGGSPGPDSARAPQDALPESGRDDR